MKTYPIMMDVRDKRVVVIGAGSVGQRKVVSLHQAQANVTLVDPELPDSLDLPPVTMLAEPYRREHLEGAAMVFVCTDDRELNARVARDARDAGAIVNAADQNEDCDFFAPATIHDGDVVVAIGTGGASPALSALLKGILKTALPENIGQFAELLSTIRAELRTRLDTHEARGAVLKRLVSRETIEAFAGDGEPAVRAKLEQILEDA
ncbi:MAG: bifunctional precorrin-2 dehydrogenase/sirohydrochlorin ferrochelatase [Phycisphaerae bacterium]|nr:bifunctional precorrin-2 dehydrogenase/sirohydrochlorin ferrochelatase [Phycisphaerae bacterium]